MIESVESDMAITDEQFDTLVLQLQAIVGALGGVEEAIREKTPPSRPTSKPPSSKRGK